MSIKKQKLEASLEGLFSGSKARSAQLTSSPSAEGDQSSSTRKKSPQNENAPFIVSDKGNIAEESSSTSTPAAVGVVKEENLPRSAEAQAESSIVQTTETLPVSLSPHAPSTVEEVKPLTSMTPSVTKSAIRPAEIAVQDLAASKIEKTIQIVTFRVNKNYYGININAVQTIIKPENACPVPFTPDYIIGLINLRGQIVPVIDLRKRLGFPTIEETKDTRIIIISIRNEWAGVQVDGVTGVINLTESEIEPPAAIVLDTDTQLLSGIGKSDSKLILILDVYALFTLGEKGKHKMLRPLLDAAA